MKSLSYAIQRARELRAEIGAEREELFERIKSYLLTEHRIRVRGVPAHEIDGNEAELSIPEGLLSYDERLDTNPIKRLLAIAHELGHLALHHKRLTDPISKVDLLLPSIYLGTGAPALARYNRLAREEIEADAFAKEFICSGSEVLEEWLRDVSVTSKTLAVARELPEDFIRVQLVEGLCEGAQANVSEEESELRSMVDDETQVKAAKHTGTPALVNAGPGTGKTATLVMRIEFLLREKNVPPKNMLVLTFSNEAADELRGRIEDEFDAETAAEMEITTFHSFGYEFLLMHGHRIGIDTDAMTVLDEARQEELLTRLLGKVECDSIIDLKHPEETARYALRQISHLKEQRVSPDKLEQAINQWSADEPEQKAAQAKATALLDLFREYEKAKKELDAVDFADLIMLPLELLEGDKVLVTERRDRHKWVMVDEYQDVSRAIALLLGKICGKDNPPWVVGDLRQAIYLFCGASRQNIRYFPEDFKRAEIFELETNYRSCDEVINVANQLGELMECPERDDGSYRKRWTRGTDTMALEGCENAVTVAQANSDKAEYDGIARQVNSWIAQGVPPSEIAILARRNIDVRNITLELGKRKIKVTTSGLITPDGAAGDLSAVATFIDGRKASLPRIVYALGRDQFDNSILDDIIFYLSEVTDGRDTAREAFGEAKTLLDEIERLDESLEYERFSGDAFSVLCAFFFDGTNYLRRALAETDEAKRSLTISEIITALARAASYRHSHTDTLPVESRIGFGEHFRANLSAAKPSLVAPRAAVDAVRAMTCHASKGLEFPCVVVAGQTLSLAKDVSWLPPALKPSPQDDRDQADALFFVGATRAQRALLISYAKTQKRSVTPLLEKWQRIHNVPLLVWETESSEQPQVMMEAVWGGAPKGKLPATVLSKSDCSIRTYLEKIYGIRFPTTLKSLYPRFYTSVRSALEKIARQAHETNRQVADGEAKQIFAREFPDEEPVGHLHYQIYLRKGAAYAVQFAQEYERLPRALEFFDTEGLINKPEEELLLLRLDLVTYYRDVNGRSHAILFRPESFPKANGKRELAWSHVESATRKRMAFVLLRKLDPDLQPWIFSGEDGRIYEYKWNRNANTMDEDAAWAKERHKAFSRGRFETVINDFWCDNECQCRIPCPYWMRATEKIN
jgi:DNA helicase II / ATP-dependent DNA helicase PcrA